MPTTLEDYVYRMALVQRMFGQEIVNTFAFRVESTTEPRDEQTFLSSLFNSTDGTYTTEIAYPLTELQDERIGVVRWDVQKVFPTVGAVYQFPLTQIGQIDSVPETANTAVCITRFGGEGGRRQRGRVAIAGMPDGSFNEGKVTTITKGLLDVWAACLHLNYSAPLGIFVLSTGFWSPEHEGIVGGQPVTYEAQYVKCIGHVVRDTVRVQRSRTVGVGS